MNADERAPRASSSSPAGHLPQHSRRGDSLPNTGPAPAANIVARTTGEMMDAFDALPAEVRAALNAANLKYDSVWILSQWHTNRSERSPGAFARDMVDYFRKFEAGL